MTTILGISGSLRLGSINSALLRAAKATPIEGLEIELASIRGIPVYDADIEAQGMPEEVIVLKERVVGTNGLLIVSPEYNNSIPGSLKNAVDWLSRPASDIPRVFGGRPVAVMGASPGGFGTILSQTAWLPVLRRLRMRTWFGGQLMVSRANRAFNDSGELTDEMIRERLREFLQGFAEFVQACERSSEHTA